METTRTIKQVATRIGHMQNGTKTLGAKLHLIFLVLTGLNLLLSLTAAELDSSTIILSIKELNNVLFIVTLHSGLNGVYTLCNRVETQMKRNFLERILPETKLAKKQFLSEMQLLMINSKKLLIFVFIMYNFLPLFQTIFILVSKGTAGVNIQNLPFVLYFYYFSYNSSLTLYFTVTILQIVCSGTSIMLLYCIFNSGFIAVKSLVFEIRMTSQILHAIDQRITADFRGGSGNSEAKLGQLREQSTQDNSLKKFFHHLIMQHQCICSDLKVVDKGLQSVILACNNSFAIQICMSIYCTREMDGLLMKLEYSLLLIWIVWIMENYSALGQQVTDEGDNLRLALNNFNWLDSPRWCHKSLLIIMTKATKTMEMKPYGLSPLNLRSFTHVINAAYSYFNILQNHN